MQLHPHDIHVWTIDLIAWFNQLSEKLAWLDPAEQQRAQRFQQPLHQKRYIAAHTGLRQILSFYVGIAPDKLCFRTDEHQKPDISFPITALRFNLSHSHDIAVCAITLTHSIGIDIERIKEINHLDVAHRFFSPPENQQLQMLPESERVDAFFRLWTRKEALIKALGLGIAYGLNKFTVSALDVFESILLENDTWSLQSLAIQPGYQCAVASNQPIHDIVQYCLPK